MAITFDANEKIIQLDSYSVSSSELWTAYVDWSASFDNIKYGVFMTQIGGLAPIALYIYILDEWLIRPLEADGITTISGNILVEDGSSPIAPTLGNWQILVNMETPIQAVSINVSSSSPSNIDDKLNIINDGIKRASLMIPHNEDL